MRIGSLLLICVISNATVAGDFSEVCSTATGSCCISHTRPGCDDEGTGCCDRVCNCDPFCCNTEWDIDCATNGFEGNDCGALIFCPECVDSDGDGVTDPNDVCCNTAEGVSVGADGRPLGDVTGDCTVDIVDYAILQGNMTLMADEPCDVSCEGVDCNDSDACTIDTCNLGECVFTEKSCCSGQVCVGGKCVPAGCVTDTDCGDGDNCTDDTCNLGTGECTNTTLACADQVCNPADGSCVDCLTDDDCDTEVGETCEDNTCNVFCVSDDDCDDGDLCTDDSCNVDTGACEFRGNCSDDGLFCNGAESCDPEIGDCISSGDPCFGNPNKPICIEQTDTCASGSPCEADADCDDDGVFCNGTESCSTDTAFCESSGDPCAADEECNEDTDACDFTGEPVTILLTLGVDTAIGTGGDDTFIANLEASGGDFFQTLNSEDNLNGAGGTDTLTAQFRHGVSVGTGAQDIEVFNLEITDDNTTGLSIWSSSPITINNLNSGADLWVYTQHMVPNFGISNVTQNTTFTVAWTALLGAFDECTLTVSNVSVAAGEPIVTIQPSNPGSGYKTINVVSEGNFANILDDLADGVGNSFATLNISGGQSFKIDDALASTVTTVNAGMANGATDLTLQGTQNVAYNGGSGNDAINFASTYTTADTIDGGGGTNTLGVNSAQAVAATTTQSNVSNINAIRIPDQLNGNVNVTRFGATDIVPDTTAAATALTAGNSVVTVGSGSPNATLNNDDTAHTLGLTVTGAGTTDTLNVGLWNSDLGNTLTCTGAETVELNSTNGKDGTAADGNANTGTSITLAPTFGTGTLNVSGDVAVTLTGAIAASTVNAGALTAAFTMGGATVAAGGATITGTAFADTLFGSNASDRISGGAGNDKIVGGQGGDCVTGGTGVNTYQYTNAADGGPANADNAGMDLINGFVIGAGGDILGFQVDIFFDDNDVLDLDIITGVAAGNNVSGLTDGGAAAAQVVVQTTPLTDFAAVATLFTTINGTITSTDAIVIAEVMNVGTFIFWDGDTTAPNGENVLGQLVGITGANLDSIEAANIAIHVG